MKKLTLAGLLALLAAPAMAHTGHGATDGFLHGFLHPLSGADHLLAMLAVGLWSGFVLPRRVWMGALTFMTAMTAGAAVAWAGFSLPLLESWITLSVLAFGLIALFSRRGQAEGITQATLTAIGLFAFCHGQAHAIEALGDVPTYLGGFLLATALLHLAGIGLARGLAERSMAQRLMGAGIAASGLYLLVG